MRKVFERARAAEAAAAKQLTSVPDWLWDGKSLPVPVESIADNHYGLLVQEEKELGWLAGLGINAHVSGLLLPHTREIWIDTEEARRAPARRRFTIGHELGHWVLHCNMGETDAEVVHCRDQVVLEQGAVEKDASGPHLASERTRFPPEEMEANQFGAAMLMPAELVRSARQGVGSDLSALAKAFGVSAMAMERRLWFLARSRDA